jgi:hypothetical protein
VVGLVSLNVSPAPSTSSLVSPRANLGPAQRQSTT